MISCDTTILFPICDRCLPDHDPARAFLQEYKDSEQFCLCEQVLLELYCLVRNPTVCQHPMSAAEAVRLIQSFRSNPKWRIIDVPSGPDFMESVWKIAAGREFAYRRVFDVRLALTLRHHGVTDFATRNVRDFRGLGFANVWDPTT